MQQRWDHADDPEHFSLPSQEATSQSQEPSYIQQAQQGPWTLNTLVEKFENLSVVIDLTNTYRYYQPRYLDENNVKHIKILTEGHVIPSKTVVRQ